MKDLKKFTSRKFGLAGAAFTALLSAGYPTEATIVAVGYLVSNAIASFSKSK